MPKADLSNKALLARLDVAKQATRGNWYLEEEGDDLLVTCRRRRYMTSIAKCEFASLDAGMDEPFASEQNANALHIATSSPDDVIATIDELLRLRKQVKRLEKEIDWLAQAAANCEWMGRRVSPKFMREAARKAVEEA